MEAKRWLLTLLLEFVREGIPRRDVQTGDNHLMISFTVYGTPAPAGSKRGFVNPKTGRVIITDDSKGSRPWKAQIADAAAETMAGIELHGLLHGALWLELVFVVPRPKGHFRTNGQVRDAAPKYPTVKPDVLKLARAVEDALSGIVYRDDSQIVSETLRKEYGEPARVEVRLMPLGGSLAVEDADVSG